MGQNDLDRALERVMLEEVAKQNELLLREVERLRQMVEERDQRGQVQGARHGVMWVPMTPTASPAPTVRTMPGGTAFPKGTPPTSSTGVAI